MTKPFATSAFGLVATLALALFVVNLLGSVVARRGRLAAADPWEAGTPEWVPPPDDRATVSAEEQS